MGPVTRLPSWEILRTVPLTLRKANLSVCPRTPTAFSCVSTAQKTERSPRITLIQMTHFLPDKLSNAGKSLQQGDHPPAQANLIALEKDSGP